MTETAIEGLSAIAEGPARLKGYRKIVLLTEGYSDPFYAKTACSMLRYRQQDVVAVLDQSHRGKTAQDLFLVGGEIPVVGSLDGVSADAMFLGIAPPGGKLPDSWRPLIMDAMIRGLDIVSGLHDFLSHDSEFAKQATDHGRQLIDVRKNDERQTATGVGLSPDCLRVLTVGHDCSVGKMVTSLEIQRELIRRDVDAGFVATGQTGIMISGDGVPVDCVVADFVNGAVESLVQRHEHHDVLMIEGQGSISHPSFSAVTMGLLHGAAPHAMIYCYEVGRDKVKGLDSIPLLSHEALIRSYEENASLRHPSSVIGIAMNSRNVSAAEAELERHQMQAEYGVPVCDVYRHGAGELANAVLDRKRELT